MQHGLAPTRPSHPGVLWLALLLAVFSALAPTVSRTLDWLRGDHAGWVEICTPTGPRWMALPLASASVIEAGDTSPALNPSPEAPAPGLGLEHCPFCLLLAQIGAPPPSAWSLQLAALGRTVVPSLVTLFFFPVFDSPLPPSRGPPSSD